jgi:lipoprotein-anchoring transpeptidase ErfK/SrfK
VPDRWLRVRLSAQELDLLEDAQVLARFPVSTAVKGAGECLGSEQTPRGRHAVREMIGAGAPTNAVFVGRQPTGELYGPELRAANPGRDWILSRVLWLDGLEEGRNRGGEVDTLARYIYILGAPDDEPMGVPHSHGCIRMRNEDVVALFEAVSVGMLVEIVE